LKIRLVVAVVALLAVGCASVSPLRPLAGGTAGQAWDGLSRAASAGGTLSTFASVRVTTPDGRRTFRATIQAGDDGRVIMSAFTPVGTEVFAFEVRDGVMVFADHSSRKSWRGAFSEIGVQLGIPQGLDASLFARLVFGLPAGRGSADLSDVSRGVVRQDGLAYELTGLGLSAVRSESTPWSVVYDPEAFPPKKVTFDDGSGRSIVVRHLDLSHSRGRLEPLAIDTSYACCFRPLITAE
jgi:hypothetical protein